MSRGLGQTQRYVLDQITHQNETDPLTWTRAEAIAFQRAGRLPTPAELETVRRAIRTLAQRGLLETSIYAWGKFAGDRHPMQIRGTWRGEQRARLCARLPLSPEQQAAEQAARDQRIAAAEARLSDALGR